MALVVAGAADRLWRPEGAAALEGLRARGLADETIRASRLGWTPGVRVPRRRGGSFVASGIVIPWRDGSGRLSLVKSRRGEEPRPKYVEAFRDRPGLYVTAPIRRARPAIVTEGEFDALLIGQELGDRAGVVSPGSASQVAAFARDAAGSELIIASPWILATDAGAAGDGAAAAWMDRYPARCRRARPPVTPADGKDRGDLHRLATAAISYCFGRLIGPWPDLDERWGPARLPEGHRDRDVDEEPDILAES